MAEILHEVRRFHSNKRRMRSLNVSIGARNDISESQPRMLGRDEISPMLTWPRRRPRKERGKCEPAKSGRTKFAGQLAWGKLSSLRRNRIELDWIFKRSSSSLAQPEQKRNRGKPEEKPSQHNCLEPMHVRNPFAMRGKHLCGAGSIISKIDRLGNGANVFAKTANDGTVEVELHGKP
jgi:hypothetical protein